MPPLAETFFRSHLVLRRTVQCDNYDDDDDDCCRNLCNNNNNNNNNKNDYLILLQQQAALELEYMKQHDQGMHHGLHRFPPACYQLVKSLAGNEGCMDCGSRRDTDWATTSYGAVLCLQCSARHRSLGVGISKVRSLTLDHWSHEQVLSMLEGGNEQLFQFWNRHQLASASSSSSSTLAMVTDRYRTKAARFYREQLQRHVLRIASDVYQGRDASRQRYDNRSSSSSAPSHNNNKNNNNDYNNPAKEYHHTI